MASFKVMHSSNSRNSDLSRRIASSTSSSSSIRPKKFRRDPNADQSKISSGYWGSNEGYSSNTMTVEGILHDTFASDPPATESTLLDASITLMDGPASMEVTKVSDVDRTSRDRGDGMETRGRSVDEVWREIVSGEVKGMKEEMREEIMTLEDYLAKAADEDAATVGNGGGESDDLDVKILPGRLNCGVGGVYGFDNSAPPHNPFQMIDKVEGSIVAFENGLDVYGGGARGKRARVMVEPLDKAAAQRQRRMIKTVNLRRDQERGNKLIKLSWSLWQQNSRKRMKCSQRRLKRRGKKDTRS